MRKNFYCNKRKRRGSKYDVTLIMTTVLVSFGLALFIAWLAIEWMYS